MATFLHLKSEERLKLINSVFVDLREIATTELTELNNLEIDRLDQSLLVLKSLLTASNVSKVELAVPEKVKNDILEEICIPFLKKSTTSGLKINGKVLCDVSAFCFPSASSMVQSDIMSVAVNALSAYTIERGLTHFKEESMVAEGVFVAVDFASRMFQDTSCCKIIETTTIPALLFNEILKTMLLAEDKVAGQVLGTLCQVLPREKSGGGRNSQLEAIWSVIRAIYENDGQKTFQCKEYSEMSERPCLLLCGMADWFFPVEGLPHSSIEIVSQPYFWELLQSGFFHANALTRKRTMYLLKRILDVIETNKQEIKAVDEDNGVPVFMWSHALKKDLSKTWEDFILLVETLEEKQVHVIRPIQPRLQSLVTACCVKPEGQPLLHTSWLTTVLQRIAGHESSHINRWGVLEVLNIDYSVCPMFEQKQTAFLCGPFMSMLSQASVYYKPSDTLLGDSPPVGHALTKFFQTCLTSLPKEATEQFLSAFFKALRNEFWSGASLVYITYGLSQATPNLVFNADIVNDIRELVTNCFANLETHFRGAVCGFLTKTLLNQTNPEQVGPEIFMAYLATLKLGESYSRGTTLWEDIVGWMKRVSKEYDFWRPSSVAGFINVSIQNWLVPPKGQTDSANGHGDNCVLKKCVGLVRFLILAEDAGLMQGAEVDLTFQSQITGIVNVIALFNGYVYASPEKAHKALEFLVHMLEEIQSFQVSADGDRVSAMVYKIVLERREEITLFIHRRVEQLEQLTDVEYVDLYQNAVRNLLEIESVDLKALPVLDSVVNCWIDKLKSEVKTQPSTRDQLQCYGSMALLSTLCKHLHKMSSEEKVKCTKVHQWVKTVLGFVAAYHPKCRFDKPTDLTAEENHSGGSPTWGRICSEYLVWQWQCLQLMSLQGEQSPFLCGGQEQRLQYVEDCLSAMDLVSNQTLAPFFSCLGQLLPMVDDAKAAETLEISLRKLLEDKRNFYFWESFDAYLEMTFQPIFLEYPTESKIHEQLQNCAMKLFELGEEKQGYANMVIYVLIRWLKSSDAAMEKSVNYVNILSKGILFGPVHSRGRRFCVEVLHYVIGLGDIVSVNQLRKSELLRVSDCQVRVQVFRFLATLQVSNAQHAALAWKLFEILVEEQKEILRITTYRNFPNSTTHRLKHRIVSALLILDCFVTQEKVGYVFGFLIDMLGVENQPSIRCMIEWMLVRLVHRYHPLRNDIWYLLKQSSEKKTAFLCSLLSIISQLSKHLTDKSEKEMFVLEALPRIFPWCMTHHFNVRVYSQAALFSLWTMATEHKLKSVLHKHSIVESFMTFCKDNEQASKNTLKLLDNFLFKFDPIKDYSIETILSTLPYLTELTDEEWIKPALFEADGLKWEAECDTGGIPLYNPTDSLKHCKVGMWRVRIETSPDEDDEIIKEGDVQKKMIPWRTMLPQKELELDYQDDYSQKKFTVPSGGLVLVTSLIDKIPNLGGLCRTCEIFGVSEFVIRNIKYTSDRSFESLSVTAQKWLPIKEVSPKYLKEYMLEMKEQGYTLVGAEQTANSQCLTSFNFPKKTLLLLGNEKEGIPVDLIQLLDVCVEIPQQGIIRSLNVHVSGALLIWEYTRQQLHPCGNSSEKKI